MVPIYFRPVLLLLVLTVLGSCTADTGDEYAAAKHKSAAPAALRRQTYNVYLENSGSLNGYLTVTGDSSFKTNVYDLITALNSLQDKQSLNLYDINTVTIPVAMDAHAAQVYDYLGGLDAATFKARSKAKGGNQSQSDLQDVFKNVLEQNGADSVSLLITDGVFSPGRGGDAVDYLSRQRSGIHGMLNEQLRRRSFSTLVLQFYSGFKGTYYYQDNTKKNGDLEDRPYYCICFGSRQALARLLDQVRAPGAFKGFHEFFFLTDAKEYPVAARIRNSSGYYDYDAEAPMTISNIHSGGRDNKFRIKFSVDFAPLPVSAAYLTDKNNYILSPGYIIDSIYPAAQGKYTHDIMLSSPRPVAGKLTFSLKKQFPAWIKDSNLDADKGLSAEALRGKTFGIRYLLEGIYDAYQAYDPQSHYFTLSISVKD